MRQRGKDTWQLRVYAGIDPVGTRKQRWLAKTVHGSRRFAAIQLRDLAEEAGRGRHRAGAVVDLLEHWFEVASPGWALSTTSQTRSIIEVYIKPYFGHLSVAKITTEDIDDFYSHLLRWGGKRDQPLAPGTVASKWPRAAITITGSTKPLKWLATINTGRPCGIAPKPSISTVRKNPRTTSRAMTATPQSRALRITGPE
jgi:hypothetical protein